MIAFDSSSGLVSNSGTTHTFSHACSGNDRLLVVYAMVSASRTISSVTYNGVSMTFKQKSSTSSQEVHVYYLIAPATGTNDVVVTIDSSSYCYPVAVSYTGVDQVTPTGNSGWNNGSSPILTLTTTVDDAWIVAGVRDGNDGVSSAGASTTQRYSDQTQAYDRVCTTSGSYSLNVSNLSTGNNGAIAGMVINPAPESTFNLLNIERSPIRGVGRGIMRP